jgi:hypothetical protein
LLRSSKSMYSIHTEADPLVLQSYSQLLLEDDEMVDVLGILDGSIEQVPHAPDVGGSSVKVSFGEDGEEVAWAGDDLGSEDV